MTEWQKMTKSRVLQLDLKCALGDGPCAPICTKSLHPQGTCKANKGGNHTHTHTHIHNHTAIPGKAEGRHRKLKMQQLAIVVPHLTLFMVIMLMSIPWQVIQFTGEHIMRQGIRDKQAQHFLFNQPNYLYPYLCSDWAWVKAEVGGAWLRVTCLHLKLIGIINCNIYTTIYRTASELSFRVMFLITSIREVFIDQVFFLNVGVSTFVSRAPHYVFMKI